MAVLVLIVVGVIGAAVSDGDGNGPGNDGAAASIMADMAVSFDTTSWWRDVTSMSTSGSILVVDTDLYPDSDATAPAQAICHAASGYVHSSDHQDLGLDAVSVRSSTGTRLANNLYSGDTC
jgi:hypothetical protein